jgi:hypothetical protein
MSQDTSYVVKVKTIGEVPMAPGPEYVNEPWFAALLEECREILVERMFNARCEVIAAKWELGKRIVTDPHFEKIVGGRGHRSFIKTVAHRLNINRTDAYYCVRFYERHPGLKVTPDVDSFADFPKEGKNISWTRIKTLYLTDPKPPPPAFTQEDPPEIDPRKDGWRFEEDEEEVAQQQAQEARDRADEEAGRPKESQVVEAEPLVVFSHQQIGQTWTLGHHKYLCRLFMQHLHHREAEEAFVSVDVPLVQRGEGGSSPSLRSIKTDESNNRNASMAAD